MTSTLLELAGFGWITYGVDRLAGVGWASLTAGLCLLLIGVATDDQAAGRFARKMVAAPGRAWRLRLAGRRPGGEPNSPHPPLMISAEADEEAARLAEAARRRLAAVR